MELSDAILMNGMMRQQGFGLGSLQSIERPCAIGGALQSIGKQIGSDDVLYRTMLEAWPFSESMTVCPIRDSFICANERNILSVIWHLNDTHKWTRERIAAWVATVEPQDTNHESTDGGQVTRHGQSSETCLVDEKVISDAL